MTDNAKIDRLKKLRALALRGVGGEKEQAQAILDKLMKKYDISFDELDEDAVNDYIFEYHGKEQERLLTQTFFKVTNGEHSIYNLTYTYSGRACKTKLRGECTAAQKIEIDFLFDFYKRLWEKEREALLYAFIQKHEIFRELRDGEQGSELSPEEYKKMLAYMAGLSDEQPQIQIEEKSSYKNE